MYYKLIGIRGHRLNLIQLMSFIHVIGSGLPKLLEGYHIFSGGSPPLYCAEKFDLRPVVTGRFDHGKDGQTQSIKNLTNATVTVYNYTTKFKHFPPGISIVMLCCTRHYKN